MSKPSIAGSRLLRPINIISSMESTKWVPLEEEREVMEAVWMQVKGACEKLKEETNAQDEHVRKMLREMADRYYL